MTFHPAGAAVPAERRTSRLLLRPLRATDVDRDYEAVMASAPMLRRWSQTDWPADDFTRAENLVDLERHEREHLERVAFTFTVLHPDGDRCLGCVYLVPLTGAIAGESLEHACRISFWVRASELDTGLARHLLDTLLEWLHEAWAFDRFLFTTSPQDSQQIALFEAAGLISTGSVILGDGRQVTAYGEP